MAIAGEASVKIISLYRDEYHEGIVECTMTESKGRILTLGRDFVCGEQIMVEPPLHLVTAPPDNPLYAKVEELAAKYDFDLEPMWYWCALNSLFTSEDGCLLKPSELSGRTESSRDKEETETNGSHDDDDDDDYTDSDDDDNEILRSMLPSQQFERISKITQERLLTLFIPEVTEPGREVNILVNKLKLRNVCDPVMLELLLQSWVHNCFEYTYEPLGYAIYFMPSFCSHSCNPNAVWVYSDKNFVLIARSKIRAGEELTLSYISEDALFETSPYRQKTMTTTKNFTCTCCRCTSPADLSRGFVCPNCKNGEIFLSPNAGTIRDLPEAAAAPVELQRNISWQSVNCNSVKEALSCIIPNNVEVMMDGVVRRLSERNYIVETELLHHYYSMILGESCLACRATLSPAQRLYLISQEKLLMNVIKSRLAGKHSNGSDAQVAEHTEEPVVSGTTAELVDSGISNSNLTQHPSASKCDKEEGRQCVGDASVCAVDNDVLLVSNEDDKVVNGTDEISETDSEQGLSELSQTDLPDTPTHKVEQRKTFLKRAKKLKSLSDRSLDKIIHRTFTQHQALLRWYAYRSTEHLDNDKLELAVDLLERKLLMKRKMFPSLAANVAWCIEDISDIYKRLVDASRSTNEDQAALRFANIAIDKYAEAVEMLRIMFGSSHEYTVDTTNKYEEVLKVAETLQLTEAK